MARPATYPEDIGSRILEARRDRTPWKILMMEFGLGRTRLWQLMKEAEAHEQKERGRDGLSI